MKPMKPMMAMMAGEEEKKAGQGGEDLEIDEETLKVLFAIYLLTVFLFRKI